MRSFLIILALAGSVQAMDIHGPLDQEGNAYNLSSWGEDRLVVVAFLGAECPLGGLYANRLNELHAKYSNRGVCFVAVNSNQHDSYAAMCEFAKNLNFSMVKDEGNVVADEFGATRSPEVFLLDASREVIYKGRIDDQYEPGVHSRLAPTRDDLEEAIIEALDWKTISVPSTTPVGCHIDRVTRAPTKAVVTYSKHIAPIFDSKCAGCHRPGEVAPFPLLSFADASAWAGTIHDVISDKRMPPWSAESPLHLVNDRSLSDGDRKLILDWIDAGAPEGDPADRPTPPQFLAGWTVKPDVTFQMATPFTVPKEGVLDYQMFVIPTGFDGDRWVDAVEVRPGNNKVVHHATIYLKPKGAKPTEFFFDDNKDDFLAMYVPGNSATIFPAGAAKRIPAGFDIYLSIHYVPNGIVQSDQTKIGMKFSHGQSVQVSSRTVWEQIELKPGEIKNAAAQQTITEDSWLVALYPHMHLRGKSMLFTAQFPDGRIEKLLDVPNYDFEWQHRYMLESPLALPAGTILRCTGVFDNSAANKRNPDPSATVHSGEATTDEMFFGIFEIGRPISTPSRAFPMELLAVVVIGSVFALRKRLSTTE